MSTINLIIGGVDFSEYVEKEDYSCIRKDVIPKTFTNYDGLVIAPRSGYYYELSVQFSELPEDVASSLAKCLDSDTISVTFTDLLSAAEDGTTTAYFNRPAEIGGSIAAETSDGDLWDMKVSLTSVVTAVSGSL